VSLGPHAEDAVAAAAAGQQATPLGAVAAGGPFDWDHLATAEALHTEPTQLRVGHLHRSARRRLVARLANEVRGALVTRALGEQVDTQGGGARRDDAMLGGGGDGAAREAAELAGVRRARVLHEASEARAVAAARPRDDLAARTERLEAARAGVARAAPAEASTRHAASWLAARLSTV